MNTNLIAIVLLGVVGGGDHNPCRRALIPDREGHEGSGHNVPQ